MPDLDLNELGVGQPGLTPAAGWAMAQCAGVCLESQGHTPGKQLTIRGSIQNSYTLDWPTTTEQVRRTWADSIEATELAAEGIAISLLRQEVGYIAIERAALGTRIDRWLGHAGDAPYFQRKARLETSGIRQGGDGDIRRRLRARITRLNLTDNPLPAYVVVVEFSRPVAEVATR